MDTLPLELLEYVSRDLKPGDLYSLCLASKRLHLASQRALYSDITIDTDDAARTIRCLQMLAGHANLARFVKSLTVIHFDTTTKLAAFRQLVLHAIKNCLLLENLWCGASVEFTALISKETAMMFPRLRSCDMPYVRGLAEYVERHSATLRVLNIFSSTIAVLRISNFDLTCIGRPHLPNLEHFHGPPLLAEYWLHSSPVINLTLSFTSNLEGGMGIRPTTSFALLVSFTAFFSRWDKTLFPTLATAAPNLECIKLHHELEDSAAMKHGYEEFLDSVEKSLSAFTNLRGVFTNLEMSFPVRDADSTTPLASLEQSIMEELGCMHRWATLCPTLAIVCLLSGWMWLGTGIGAKKLWLP